MFPDSETSVSKSFSEMFSSDKVVRIVSHTDEKYAVCGMFATDSRFTRITKSMPDKKFTIPVYKGNAICESVYIYLT